MRNIADAYLNMVSSNVEPIRAINKNIITEVVSAIAEVDKRDIPVKISNEQLQRDIAALKKYVDSKNIIPQISATAGSGEVRILRMDDINISAIQDNRMLVWDTGQKKFRFIDVPVASNLGRPTILTSIDYAPNGDDFYIGVNSANIVSITLPEAVVNGKEYIIKDESGHAQSTPIKVIGTIDNDINGVELRINNGSISLIYRNGWRII